MKTIFISVFVFIIFFSSSFSQKKVQVYDAPDQAVWHEKSRTWFVSNLGGGISLEKDANGWVTRTDEFGNVIAPFWIGKEEGMHAPSGMVATKKFLYVVDREGVFEINIKNEKVETFYPIPEGEFLNDVAISESGDLYISDFFGNKIFKIDAVTKKVNIWLESDRLEAPDGLYMEKDKLIVASWGVLLKPSSFETSKLGDLLSIDLETKNIQPIATEAGNLEGITKIKNNYYITDWAAGKLLKIDPKKQQVEIIMTGLKYPTDPNYSKKLNILAFPQHGTNQVLFIKLN
ncbi:hypothetical protein KFZ70_12575 [Tamlana fucoidanivorans]|uniref:SMP-30/gluconolactonase/LRE family protein n=1 Tax=Allotamlana fucoidanivorans TaxID=2583814 RepID=A0A5C4SLW3_9FLAO|nr:hypothetical protein [Tamlana fucoidanivorans]TNJ44895.1 hypothetical protein FGF67_06950 [Tamlana fucoidanivorans]